MLRLAGIGYSCDVSLVHIALDGASWVSKLAAVAAKDAVDILGCLQSLALTRLVCWNRWSKKTTWALYAAVSVSAVAGGVAQSLAFATLRWALLCCLLLL